MKHFIKLQCQGFRKGGADNPEAEIWVKYFSLSIINQNPILFQTNVFEALFLKHVVTFLK